MDKQFNIATIDEDISIVTYKVEDIKKRIYTIRGRQVMLDSEVAMLYHYETKRINETVSRNKARFPENFCFQLTEHELEILKSQFATSGEQENNWLQIADASECETMRSQFATASKKK